MLLIPSPPTYRCCRVALSDSVVVSGDPEVVPKVCVPAVLVRRGGCDLAVDSPTVQQWLMSNRRVTSSTSSSPEPDETVSCDSFFGPGGKLLSCGTK